MKMEKITRIETREMFMVWVVTALEIGRCFGNEFPGLNWRNWRRFVVIRKKIRVPVLGE